VNRCPTDDLLLDFLQDRPSVLNEGWISAHVADCPRCRGALSDLEALVLDAAREMPQPGPMAEARVVEAIRRASPARPRPSAHPAALVRWAIAAAVLLAATVSLIGLGTGFRSAKAGPIVATVVSAGGHVVVLRGGVEQPAVVGMGLLEGDQLAVPAEATAILDLPDASRAEMGPESLLTLHRPRDGANSLELQGGFLAVDATRRPAGPPLSIRTPDARAEVLGTRFTLGANSEETHLRVAEGLVHLVRLGDGASVDVAGGHRSEVSGARGGLESRPSLPGTVLIISSHDRGPADFARFDSLVGERLLGRRLRHLGFRVETKGHGEVSASDLVGRPLVIVSYSEEQVGYEQSLERIRLREARVPVLCFEPLAFPALGMTGARRGVDFDWQGGRTPVEMALPGHPLSGGLAGRRTDLFREGSEIGWARPGPEAWKVAVLTGDRTRVPYFAFEAGARMVGTVVAPERRVGLFLDPSQVVKNSEAGWTLVEAAVEWSVEPPSGQASGAPR